MAGEAVTGLGRVRGRHERVDAATSAYEVGVRERVEVRAVIVFRGDDVVDAGGEVTVEVITVARVASYGVLVAGAAAAAAAGWDSVGARAVAVQQVVMFVLFLGVVQQFLRGRWRVARGGGLEGVDDAR